MSYSKLIHDYLDGELNDAEKDALFGSLASDTLLRNEFEHQVKIQTIAQSDMSTISPPIELTSSIFAGLGFRIPSQVYLSSNGGAGNIHNGNWFLRWKGKYAILLVALIASVFTASVFITYDGFFRHNSKSSAFDTPKISSFSNDDNGQNNNSTIGSSNYSLSSAFYLSNNPNESIGNHNDGAVNNRRDANNSGSNMIRHAARRGHAISDDLVNAVDLASGSQNGTILPVEKSGINNIISHNDLHNGLQAGNQNYTRNNVPNPVEFVYSPLSGDMQFLTMSTEFDNSKFSAELRKTPGKSIVSMNLNSQQGDYIAGNRDGLLEYSIGAYYKLNQNNQFGIEIGREQFFQAFQVTGKGIQYQSPVLLWIGASYRFILPEYGLNRLLYPYGQIAVAYTTIGPVLRPQLGLRFQPVSSFSFSLGYEASYLIYNVETKLYGSGNYGFTYGINYHF